jgi:hypothetical protein
MADRDLFGRTLGELILFDHSYAVQADGFGAEDQGSLLWIATERVRGVSNPEREQGRAALLHGEPEAR